MSHCYWRSCAALWIFVPFLLAGIVPLQADQMAAGSAGRPGFGQVELRDTEIFSAQDASDDIRLRTISHHHSGDNVLYLDFDQEIPELLRDQAGRYRIAESSYIYNREARYGKGAALFNRLENRVVIKSPEELWPGTGPSGDFTIEMWLKPIYFYRKNLLFRKMNVLEGSRRGLEIYLEDDRLYLNCASLFKDARGRLHSLRLGSRSPLRTQQWIHLSVSFEAASGRLRLFLDGREDNVAHTGDAAGVWQMTFHPLDRSPIVIAETYAGFLDEFRISSRALQPDASHLQTATYAPLRLDYETLRGQQQMGQVISDVMRPSGGTARSGRLRYLAQEPDGTLVNFYARFARQPFAKDTPAAELPWRRLSPDEARGVQMFSYFQWRAELRADPSGLVSPVLREVVLDYQPLLAPPAPGNLRAVPDFRLAAGLVLEWDESPETRVQTGGGYYVYFGLRPGEYLGRLHVNAQGQPIRASTAGETPLSDTEKKLGHSRPERLKQSLRNRMRLLIDNELIQTNTPPNAQAPRLPYLHANRSYYFAVSSYDDVGVESQLSNEVVVTIRPPAD